MTGAPATLRSSAFHPLLEPNALEPNALEPSLSRELLACLQELFGDRDADLRTQMLQRLAPAVYRVRLESGGRVRSLIVKHSDPWMARRNGLVAERWLPAVGLSAIAPPLLGTRIAGGGERVWQLYEDLGDSMLDEGAPDARLVHVAVAQIARMHSLLGEHPLLAECRLWGTDYGMHFYSTNVRDARRCIERLRAEEARLGADVRVLCDRLLEQLSALQVAERSRATLLTECGGPETLLHGDLWPKNIIFEAASAPVPRLVDWDRVGVGRVSYDLSTFLSRFPARDRRWILADYRAAFAEAGGRLTEEPELELLFDIAECARLVNRLIWPAIALLQDPRDRDWALIELSTFADWLDQLRPLLPSDSEERSDEDLALGPVSRKTDPSLRSGREEGALG